MRQLRPPAVCEKENTMNSIMLQGTGSDVGKSVLAAGICRAFCHRGLTVRPFKAQNMSNNAAPACNGGEIGRAQALQALACHAEPVTDMNPVLLKPQSDCESQVIVNGQVYGILHASDFLKNREPLLALALESYHRLQSECDIVVAEGGGSPAEVNLRAGDIVNMGFARAADMPVILAGDISRGGVIASLVGTKAVLDEKDAAMIQGFLVNLFRGDLGLFDEGAQLVEKMTGWKNLGVVPWLQAARNLPAEDAIRKEESSRQGVTIAVPVLPHIANFDDFDPLAAEEEVNLVYVYPGHPIPAEAEMVILPGTKTTISDLEFLRRQEWDIDLRAHIRRGGYVLGICGGYQMLGKTVADPMGIEGEKKTVSGLGLLPIHTVLNDDKRVAHVTGVSLKDHVPFQGYEIHCGQTKLEEGAEALLQLESGRTDGAVDREGRVAGCYIHRLFDHPKQRAKWLDYLHAGSDGMEQGQRVEDALDEVAEELERCLNLDAVLQIARDF